ncbi:MAG: hypothetical protein JNJ55_05925 [Betaproteobacteria bacterium]|nr:hypothetical protein [Betaproteobacteria bacterium]
MERIYPPEKGVDLDAVYSGKGGRALRWRYLKAASYPIVPEPFAENSVFYAVTDVFSDIDRDVWLDIGADDDTKLWVNDKLVWTHGTGTKPWYQQAFTRMHAELARYALVEATQRVHLRKGANRLMLKHYNGCCLTFFSVVLRP